MVSSNEKEPKGYKRLYMGNVSTREAYLGL
jgi:hypothetical protein